MLSRKPAIFALLLALRVTAQLDDETLGLSQHAFHATSNSTVNESLRPVVDLGYTSYRGQALSSGITQWLGMRYAAKPVGDLRFRAPVDPPKALIVQDALNVNFFSCLAASN